MTASVRAPKASQTRRRALEVLHAADVAGAAPALRVRESTAVRAIVDGVTQHRDEIDAAIRARAEHWALERMPVVDRNLLRIGAFELMFTDTPAGVVVSEAVNLAKLLSTEESHRFVNGVLGGIARDRRA